MPTVKNPAALKKAYEAAAKKVAGGDIPTTFVYGGHTVFRSINPTSPYSSLPKPRAGGSISLAATIPLLRPPDATAERGNRFSGPSYNPSIPPMGGVYCVLQQQALMNESAHYSGKAHAWGLVNRCVLRMRITGTINVGDLSPHNPRAIRFFRELGPKVWNEMNDPQDCSVARGVALAFAQASYLHGISVQTVRESDRSDEERGDNIVFFSAGPAISCLEVDKVYYFGKTSTPEVFPVTRP